MEVSSELLTTICIVYDVIYAVIGFFGVAGNILVILVIASNRAMHTTTNIYIASMAISDLAFLVVCVPLNIYVIMSVDGWKLGSFLCAGMQYLMYTTVLATCLTMSILAIDRFLAITYPLDSLQFRLPQTAIIVNLLVWAASCLLSVPVFVMTWPSPTKDAPYCDWQTDPLTIFIFYVGFFVVSFIIPMLVIIYCYGSIFRSMLYSNTTTNNLNITAAKNNDSHSSSNNNNNNKNNTNTNNKNNSNNNNNTNTNNKNNSNNNNSEMDSEHYNKNGLAEKESQRRGITNGYRLAAPPARIMNQRRRVTKMVTIIIVCFLVLWCPVHYINLSYRYKSAFGGLGDFTLATALSALTARALIFIASSINPVIYAFAGENFRGYMRAFFNRCRRRNNRPQTGLNPNIAMHAQRNPRMNLSNNNLMSTHPRNAFAANAASLNGNGTNTANRYQAAAPRSGNPSSQTYV